MKTTLGCLRKADTDFNLIEPGDRVGVGVSGGKDSLLLLYALSLYRRFSHKNFSLYAFTVTISPAQTGISDMKEFCDSLRVPLTVRDTEIGTIIFQYRHEKNPCALCAKMRRAVLADMCREAGCNKLALGHHREDAIETLMMSLLYEGRFHTFHPKTYMSRSGITVIRPLVYLPESHVIHVSDELSLPVTHSVCPANGKTKREEMKNLLQQLKSSYPDMPDKILHALRSDRYDLWQKNE